MDCCHLKKRQKKTKETLTAWYTRENTSPYTVDGKRIDSQLGKPFLISHGKKPESESAFRRAKNKTTKTGKAFKRPGPPDSLSTVSRCKHAHADNIVWWGRLEPNAEGKRRKSFCCKRDRKPFSCADTEYNETERGAEAKDGDKHN